MATTIVHNPFFTTRSDTYSNSVLAVGGPGADAQDLLHVSGEASELFSCKCCLGFIILPSGND